MNFYKSILLLVVGMLLLTFGCEGGDKAEVADREAVKRQQEQYQESQPIPFFEFSLERDIAIQLYKARNERVATWTVWRSDYGMVLGDCPSIGYPLPYDTSLTNPLKTTHGTGSQYGKVLEQAEPNGLYSSKNSIATWVRCVTSVNGSDVEAPIYIEGKVNAYPYPVTVDYEKNRVKPVAGATPSVTISKSQ